MPSVETQADAVILANGNFPEHNIPLSILNNSKFLICCDGAINKLSLTDKEPNAIVGDCDSLSESNKEKYKRILHPNSDQETNDLTKAVNFCLNLGLSKIIILGATGQREDHTLGNISLLIEYKSRDIDVIMITDHGVFTPIITTTTFESYEGQQVSIFSFSEDKLTSIGLKYPIKERIFSNWWQGTLNESISENFIIETTGKHIVFRVF